VLALHQLLSTMIPVYVCYALPLGSLRCRSALLAGCCYQMGFLQLLHVNIVVGIYILGAEASYHQK